MVAYYNEIDGFCAQWLRNLIRDEIIAPGDVDDRDIREVHSDDVAGYDQCHFFAGVGGWSVALRLAGWEDERMVWTGSPPCQPFSSAGKQKGKEDERHLAPTWIDLIGKCTPPTVFGEQVASSIAHGWVDDIFDALETIGYACGASVIPACGVGAPHKRSRLWIVAQMLADSDKKGWHKDTEKSKRQEEKKWYVSRRSVPEKCKCLVNANRDGLKKRSKTAEATRYRGAIDTASWEDVYFITDRDGDRRPVKRGIYPLAYGLQRPSPSIAPYGNAIVPQVAAEFISAFMKCIP